MLYDTGLEMSSFCIAEGHRHFWGNRKLSTFACIQLPVVICLYSNFFDPLLCAHSASWSCCLKVILKRVFSSWMFLWFDRRVGWSFECDHFRQCFENLFHWKQRWADVRCGAFRWLLCSVRSWCLNIFHSWSKWSFFNVGSCFRGFCVKTF